MRAVHAAGAMAALLVAGVAARAEAQLQPGFVVSGLTRPVGFVQDPSDPTVQMVLEQAGRIRVLKNGLLQPTDFVDLRSTVLSGGERGLLGLAFSPDYATTGRIFVCFTDHAGDIVIARLRRSSADPSRIAPESRFDLVWPDGRRSVRHPFSNHNGGHLAFGPDGFLYAGMGDGGSANDPQHLAQDPQSLLGKMLRLDVSVPDDDPRGYRVPPANPYAARGDVLREIWSFGWRNPWRWSFDNRARGGTGAIVAADVGQNRWEEINYEPAGTGGRNYGWRLREGAHDNVMTVPPFSLPLRDPIWEYSHTEGRSITGGYVYRGRALGTGFVGRYVFADFVSSRVWSLRLTVDPISHEAVADDLREHTTELGTAGQSITSFGEDTNGELYLVSYNGTIYRIDPPPGQEPAPDPTVPSPNPNPPAEGSGSRRGEGTPTGQARPRVR